MTSVGSKCELGAGWGFLCGITPFLFPAIGLDVAFIATIETSKLFVGEIVGWFDEDLLLFGETFNFAFAF